MLRNKDKIEKVVKLLKRIDKVIEILEAKRNSKNYTELTSIITRMWDLREIKARPITPRRSWRSLGAEGWKFE